MRIRHQAGRCGRGRHGSRLRGPRDADVSWNGLPRGEGRRPSDGSFAARATGLRGMEDSDLETSAGVGKCERSGRNADEERQGTRDWDGSPQGRDSAGQGSVRSTTARLEGIAYPDPGSGCLPTVRCRFHPYNRTPLGRNLWRGRFCQAGVRKLHSRRGPQTMTRVDGTTDRDEQSSRSCAQARDRTGPLRITASLGASQSSSTSRVGSGTMARGSREERSTAWRSS